MRKGRKDREEQRNGEGDDGLGSSERGRLRDPCSGPSRETNAHQINPWFQTTPPYKERETDAAFSPPIHHPHRHHFPLPALSPLSRCFTSTLSHSLAMLSYICKHGIIRRARSCPRINFSGARYNVIVQLQVANTRLHTSKRALELRFGIIRVLSKFGVQGWYDPLGDVHEILFKPLENFGYKEANIAQILSRRIT
ncbi:MAG: hypothetical protein Q9172_007428 [Xanthocarpia lactea]